jgi:hypothetical protein
MLHVHFTIYFEKSSVILFWRQSLLRFFCEPQHSNCSRYSFSNILLPEDEYRWAKTEEELLSKTADVHDTLYALSSRNLQNHLLIRRYTIIE